MEAISKKFKPTKDMFYVYFRFRQNEIDDILDFRNEIVDEYPDLILGSNITHQINYIEVFVYLRSQEDCDKIKNDNTLAMYQKYVGKGGFQDK